MRRGLAAFSLVLMLGVNVGASTVPNDDFAAALVLTGPRGVVTCDTLGATRETGEPAIPGKGNAGGASVWFRWTAPTTGSFKLDTESSEFNTLLAVYTNSTLSSLALITSNDDIDRNLTQSQVTLNVVAGRTYQITIDGKDAAAGYAVFTWAPATSTNLAPANNNFAASGVLSGAGGSVTASTINASKEAGEPFHAGVPDGKTVWFRWVAPAAGLACFDTVESDFDTIIAAYQGSTVSNLTKLKGNNDIDNLTRQSRIIFRAVAGQEYRLVVGGVQMPSGTVREGTAIVNWLFDAGAGNNDMFAQAQALSGPHGWACGLNTGATAEAGEPIRPDNPGGQSVWYRWQAPVSGPVVFDTTGSQFDAMLYTYLLLTVYVGDSLPGLTRVVDNYDPTTPGYFNSVSFYAQVGVNYYISVDGFYDPMFCHCVAAGTIYLAWTQPGVVMLSSPRLLPDQTVEMDVVASKGAACTVLSSTDLAQWGTHTNLVLPSFQTTVRAGAQPAQDPKKFFRAVVTP